MIYIDLIIRLKHMKKHLIILLMIISFIPSIASASWWNPFSWFSKSKIEQTIVQPQGNNTSTGGKLKIIENKTPGKKIIPQKVNDSNKRFIDFCKNIEGTQTFIPSGMYRDNDNCLPVAISKDVVPRMNWVTPVNWPLKDSFLLSIYGENLKNNADVVVNGESLGKFKLVVKEGFLDSLQKNIIIEDAIKFQGSVSFEVINPDGQGDIQNVSISVDAYPYRLSDKIPPRIYLNKMINSWLENSLIIKNNNSVYGVMGLWVANMFEDYQPGSGMEKAEYYIDEILISTVTVFGSSGPSKISWDTTKYPDGEHKITIKIYDKAGNTATESSVVNIKNNISPSNTPVPFDGSSGGSGCYSTGSGGIRVQTSCLYNAES